MITTRQFKAKAFAAVRSIKAWLWFIAIVLAVVHFYAMVFVPLLLGSWAHTQEVWDRWQTFNTGMIGLYAALLTIGQYLRSSEVAAKRKFKSSMIVLSSTLSHVARYNRECAKYLDHTWGLVTTPSGDLDPEAQPLRNQIKPTSERQETYVAIFKELVEHGYDQPDLAIALHRLCARMQIMQARIDQIGSVVAQGVQLGHSEHNLLKAAIYLIRNQSYVEALFPFSHRHRIPAEGHQLYHDAPLTPELAANGFINLPFSAMRSRLEDEVTKLVDPDPLRLSLISLKDSLQL